MISENLLKDRSFSWFDVVEPKNEDFNTLSANIGLPYLLVQDMLKPEHLPKYESSEEGDFLMLRSFDPESSKESTTVQELTRKIALYITKDRMVSVHRVELDVINKLKDKVKRNEAPKTIQELVHQLILNMIRTYELPLTNLQDIYEDFEADVLSRKCEYLDSTRIYHFRRQLFILKRILKQTQDALYRSRNFWEENHSMLQDLKENIDQVYFQLDEISDSFEHLFQLHISLSDQRANDVMKVLTVFSSVLLPLNFIASFYGMNFEFIPGLHSKTALGWVVVVMILISVFAIFYFKRKGWFNSRPD
jgi:magnesium transporter